MVYSNVRVGLAVNHSCSVMPGPCEASVKTFQQCAKCGFQNIDSADRCVSCGASLREFCPHCHALVRLSQKFCGSCRGALSTTSDGSSQIQTPLHPLERVRGSQDVERKIITVLFADIASSTALIDDRDAEDARQILKPTVDAMNDIVHHYGGITQEQGDGIMASFGARVALEDHAVRACYAALDMQEASLIRAAEVRREFGMLFEIRIGINSGPVVVTVKHQAENFIDMRFDGVATHIAKRVESLAAPGTILVTRDTLALAKGFVRVKTIGSVPLRGIAGPVEIYELEGVNTRNRMHALAARGLSKFVGRQHEIESLNRAAMRAEAAHGQVVALVGEAGVGKSRIFLEFAGSLGVQGWLILEGGSASYDKATSYFPLVSLLSRYFQIQDRDTEQQVRERVGKKLLALGDEKLLAQLPLITGALGILVSDDAWANFDPSERQSLIFDAVKRLLVRESQNQPLCLVIEDMHWIDAETQTFLEMLSESIPAARILLLVNYRPEYENPWIGKSYFSQLSINPLAAASADELLDTLLGSDTELLPIKKRLIEATQGNPLFLEECVRSLIENGVLDQSSGRLRAVAPLAADFVPGTIEALLAARIDHLRPELKELLQCAAVIGNDIKEALLEAVTGIAQPDLRRAIHDLQVAEFLYEKALLPEMEYAFKHSMTREVAYASLLRERRTILHARAARSLETLAAGRVDEQIERLADHAERGAIWDKALEYLQRSGLKAYSLYANADAARFFERALTVLKKLPETPDNLKQAVDLRFEIRNALLPSFENERILRCLDEIEPILARLGDKQRSAQYAAFRCNQLFFIGHQRRAIEFGETGVRLARECGDRGMLGQSLFRVGQSYHALGEYRQAIPLLEQGLEFNANELRHDHHDLIIIPSVLNRTWLAFALVECGDFSAAMTHAKRALEIAEGAEHQLSELLGWLSIGSVLLRKGEIEGAVGALERGFGLCDRWAFQVWRIRLVSALGVAYARSGRTQEGLQFAAQAVSDGEKIGLIVDKPRLLVRLGQVSLIARQIEAALTLGQQAAAMAVAQEGKGDEAWARFLIGSACWASEPKDFDESEKQLNAALRLAGACEARPLAALCRTTLCGIYARRGDQVRAKEFEAAATATYQELGIQPLSLEPTR
jgi:class 3 adenylate cyclase/tetratricopeptide (TPR) repeat protein